jgi:hypothetical protein
MAQIDAGALPVEQTTAVGVITDRYRRSRRGKSPDKGSRRDEREVLPLQDQDPMR